VKARFSILILFGALFLSPTLAADPDSGGIPPIKPAKTLNTGLPLLPDLDLSNFSTEEFSRLSSTVGATASEKPGLLP
jgi:hypothetical protein